MSDLNEAPELRVDELFATLARCQVRLVVVGGIGSQLHGATRVTKDLDVCPASGQENSERLAGALEELGGRLRLAAELGDVEVRPNAKLLREFPITRWRTRAGDVDVMIAIAGEDGRRVGFRELEARAVVVHVRDAAIIVAALEDIVRSKEHANRPKDQQALPELRALLAQRKPAGRAGQREQTQRPEAVKPRSREQPLAAAPHTPRRYPPPRGPTLGR